MMKDKQGGRRRARKRPEIKPDDPESFTKAMERTTSLTASTVESRLLPISRALSDTTHKARLAQEAGSGADFDRLAVLLSQQRLQITLAEPENALDVLVMASTAMLLANVLRDIDGEEGIRQAAQELFCTLGAIRRFHEAQIGVTCEALGLNGRPLQQ